MKNSNHIVIKYDGKCEDIKVKKYDPHKKKHETCKIPKGSKKVLVSTVMSDNCYTFDYSQDGIYFLAGGHVNTKTLGLKINNMPHLIHSPTTSQTYSIKVIMKGNSSKFAYVDKIQMSESSSNYTEIIPRFASNTEDAISSLAYITSSNYVIQHFTYIYLDGSWRVFSSINSFV